MKDLHVDDHPKDATGQQTALPVRFLPVLNPSLSKKMGAMGVAAKLYNTAFECTRTDYIAARNRSDVIQVIIYKFGYVYENNSLDTKLEYFVIYNSVHKIKIQGNPS